MRAAEGSVMLRGSVLGGGMGRNKWDRNCDIGTSIRASTGGFGLFGYY